MLLIPHRGYVRVNAPQHLAAGGARAAGLSLFRRAFHCRGGKTGRARPVARAGEQQRVGQRTPLCSGADAGRRRCVFQFFQLRHGNLPYRGLRLRRAQTCRPSALRIL
ncbi:hypothetical protein SDC9_195442 [bioreactor metagenome]|uniref:Uncharacterized protein n=1 Tax=bioreactor metagenome TaxID=1076179 RepID=A0A645I9B1_9ZZZZ